ncbi:MULTISPECIES: (2Fe-2S)-binding protein [Tomitella]|uniref:Bacterioferritin-associated ferredoxin n=2 Tax=Tomitella TaxID=741759 RepID=A0A516X2J8_9ACTN|nr:MULTISPECIES: (2Fe-2S)-binding protein [Tomitella]QDQ96841.1 (2Fe-2S)-binding protein [Tomitella fengzijianii]
MYVCMCHAFTDEDIRAQIACGHTSVNKIGRSCGAGRDCGACVKKIQAILRSKPAEGGTIELKIAG